MDNPAHSSVRVAIGAICILVLVSSSCTQKSAASGASETDTAAATDPNQVADSPSPPQQQPAVTPTPSAPSSASPAQIAELSKPSGGANGGLYTVKDGTKVDEHTLAGWKTWRALACDRCHGAEQQGLVGPPLLVSLHRLTKDEFKKTLTDGRIDKGMPPFNTSPMVMANVDNLYAYLKGRADAQIQPGHLYPLDSQ